MQGGSLPWASTPTLVRSWLRQTIQLDWFRRVHQNAQLGKREYDQLILSLLHHGYLAIVCADTKDLYVGRWALALLSLFSGDQVCAKRGYRRGLFMSMDSEGGILFVTTRRRLEQQVWSSASDCWLQQSCREGEGLPATAHGLGPLAHNVWRHSAPFHEPKVLHTNESLSVAGLLSCFTGDTPWDKAPSFIGAACRAGQGSRSVYRPILDRWQYSLDRI